MHINGGANSARKRRKVMKDVAKCVANVIMWNGFACIHAAKEVITANIEDSVFASAFDVMERRWEQWQVQFLLKHEHADVIVQTIVQVLA